MSTFEDIYCSQCNCKTDQALMLSCEHNLCMNCAAKYLSRENPQSSNIRQYIICELCGSKTEIDNQTSKEILSTVLKNLNINPDLINMNNNNQNKNDNNLSNNINPNLSLNNAYNNEIIMNSNDYQNNNYNSNINSLLIANSNIVNMNNLCRDHGEPISYLCLDCMSKCICSECIVHGIHCNHNVLNIKKAYPLILGKTQDLHRIIGNKINELNNEKRKIEQKKSDIGTINLRCKNEIKNEFQVIRIRLNEKEKEIIEKMESALKDNLNELNTYFHVIQDKIETLNKIIDSLNAHLMRKDELTLINYYCDNKNNILYQIENINNNKCFNINAISDLKIKIDKNSFNNMLTSLNNLDFEINCFRGVDICRQFDNGKYAAQRNLYGMNFNYGDYSINLNLKSPRYSRNRNFNIEIPKLINISQDVNNQKRTNSAKRDVMNIFQ